MRILQTKVVHLPEGMVIIEMAMPDFKRQFKCNKSDFFQVPSGAIYWLDVHCEMCIVGVPQP